jgi:hypothetical protein
VIASRIVGALLGGLLCLAATGAAAQGTESRTSIARPMVTGTFIDAVSGQGAFSGNIALARFEVRQRSLVVVGMLTGILAESRGSIIGRVNEEVELPVVVVSGTCQLLHLDVGPLDHEFLGVQVHLEKGALGITTRDGPDRALLCSTAGLLASKPTPEAIATRLNAVLGKLDPSR